MEEHRVHSAKDLQEAAYRLPEHWIWRQSDREWHMGLSRLIAGLLRERLTGGNILDVGCGDGKGTSDVQEALASGFTLSGMDYSTRAIAFARLMAENIHFWVSDVSEPLAGAQKYDAVIFREIIEHLTEEEGKRGLANVFGFLKPGGLLVLTAPHAAMRVIPKHYRHYVMDDLASRVSEAGFVNLEFFGYGKVPPMGLVRPLDWVGKNLPVLWRICRLWYVPTSPRRCRNIVCLGRRPLDD